MLNKGDSVLVAVSGGKDSLSLWHILTKFGYAPEGLYIDLGINGYSDRSLKKVLSFAKEVKARLWVVSLKEIFGLGIKELARVLKRPYCSACGTFKRYLMNRISMERNLRVLATGHNLDDEVSSLLGNLLYWKEEYLWKKNVVLEEYEGHLAKKIKPFFLISEREIAAYAFLSGIDYIYEECPYSVGAKTLLYKEILSRIEDQSPGTKLMFLKGYLKRLKAEKEGREQGPVSYCTICNYPSWGQKCVFCSLTERLDIPYKFEYKEYDFSK
ncbi:MAG: TIGR00269 family protein [Deltaproteobacteria bacterium]|nr:TIGR00269 family protein [Deltaproteobacteria bacterium]